MSKVRLNTRKHLHARDRAAARERKEDRAVADSGFMYRHTDQMRKMLKDVDPDRFERLADG